MTKMLNPLRRVKSTAALGLAGDENGTITHQIDAHPAGRGMNSGLARALVRTHWCYVTLAGALIREPVKGANYAAKV